MHKQLVDLYCSVLTKGSLPRKNVTKLHSSRALVTGCRYMQGTYCIDNGDDGDDDNDYNDGDGDDDDDDGDDDADWDRM